MTMSSTPRSLGGAIRELREKWGWFLAFGVALTALGFLALGYVVVGTIVSVVFNGFLMIVAGAAEVMFGFRAKTWGRMALLIAAGAIYVVAGLITVNHPLLAATVFTLLLGAGLVATGIVRLVLAFQLPAEAPRWWVAIGAVVTTLLGIMILASWPGSSLVLIGTFLAIELIFQGVGWITFALGLKNAG